MALTAGSAGAAGWRGSCAATPGSSAQKQKEEEGLGAIREPLAGPASLSPAPSHCRVCRAPCACGRCAAALNTTAALPTCTYLVEQCAELLPTRIGAGEAGRGGGRPPNHAQRWGRPCRPAACQQVGGVDQRTLPPESAVPGSGLGRANEGARPLWLGLALLAAGILRAALGSPQAAQLELHGEVATIE